MDSLSGNVFALKVTCSNSLGDFTKMHRLFMVMQNNVNLVTDILGINHRPFSQAPAAMQRCHILGNAGQCLDMLGVRITDLKHVQALASISKNVASLHS